MSELTAQLQRAGWKVTTRKGGHLLASCPDGCCRIIMAASASDWRADKNSLARIRKNHPGFGRHTHTRRTGRMPGRAPGPEMMQRYVDAVEYCVAHPNRPFDGKNMKQDGVQFPSEVMDRIAMLTSITYRLADGGHKSSTEAQKFWDQLNGGLLYQTRGAGFPRQYVYDTAAKLGKRGILGNQWPVVVAGKVEWPVRALEETGPGTARVITAAGSTSSAALTVTPDLKLIADHGTHVVLQVGGEVVVCQVLSRGGK